MSVSLSLVVVKKRFVRLFHSFQTDSFFDGKNRSQALFRFVIATFDEIVLISFDLAISFDLRTLEKSYL